MNKDPEEYNRIYIVTDYRKDVKFIVTALNLEKYWKPQDPSKQEIKHLTTHPHSFRGYHFKEDDLVIMGRANGPIEDVVEATSHIKNYPPSDQKPEIIYETG